MSSFSAVVRKSRKISHPNGGRNHIFPPGPRRRFRGTEGFYEVAILRQDPN